MRRYGWKVTASAVDRERRCCRPVWQSAQRSASRRRRRSAAVGSGPWVGSGSRVARRGGRCGLGGRRGARCRGLSGGWRGRRTGGHQRQDEQTDRYERGRRGHAPSHGPLQWPAQAMTTASGGQHGLIQRTAHRVVASTGPRVSQTAPAARQSACILLPVEDAGRPRMWMALDNGHRTPQTQLSGRRGVSPCNEPNDRSE